MRPPARAKGGGLAVAILAMASGCQFDGGGIRENEDPPDARPVTDPDGSVVTPVDASAIDPDAAVAIDAGRIDEPDAARPDASEREEEICQPDPDLLACLSFEGEAEDLSTYHHAVFSGGLAFSPGVRGQGLAAGDGVDVRIAEASVLDPTRLTIEMWIRPLSFPEEEDRVGLLDNNTQWGLFGRADGQVTCSMQPASLTLDGVLDEGEWQHLACTYDGSRIRIYRNRQLAGSADTQIELNTDGSEGTTIGRNNPDGEYLDGSVDEVRIWRRALDPEELDGGGTLPPP